MFAHAARMLAPLAFALHIESLPFSCIPTKVPFSVPGQCDQFSHVFNVRRVFFEKTIPPRVLDWPGGDPEAFAEMQAAYQILCSASWTATLLLCHFLWRSNRRYDLFLGFSQRRWILTTWRWKQIFPNWALNMYINRGSSETEIWWDRKNRRARRCQWPSV